MQGTDHELAISARRKDEHHYARMGKGEIASPNGAGRLLPLWATERTRYRGRALRAQHCCEVLVSWRRFAIGGFGVAAVLP